MSSVGYSYQQNIFNTTISNNTMTKASYVGIEIPLTVGILLVYVILGHNFETYKHLQKKKSCRSSLQVLAQSQETTHADLDTLDIDRRLEGFYFRGFLCSFHESGPAILLGLMAGLLLNHFGAHLQFSQDGFYYFVLPPIIFYQGYSLRKKKFFKYLVYIFGFGMIGTVLQFGIITLVTYWMINTIPFFELKSFVDDNGKVQFSLRESMIISACFSAADEIATLSLIKANEHPKLSAILFGEGVFNDAMSILLFKTVDQTYSVVQPNGSVIQENELNLSALLTSSGVLLGVGLLVGVGCGLIVSRILKVLPLMQQNPAKQTAVVMLGGYLSFCAPEAFGLSGILSVFFCGLTLSYYAWHSLTLEAKSSTKITFDTLSMCAEAYCFACIGMSTNNIQEDHWSWKLLLVMLVALVISRAVAIYTISFLGWITLPKNFTICIKEQTVLFVGGLVRGAIAWAQVSQVTGVKHAELIQTTTLGVIIVTTLAFGVLLPPIIKILNITSSDQPYLGPPADTEVVDRPEGISRMFHSLNDKWLCPFFGEDKSLLRKPSKNQMRNYDGIFKSSSLKARNTSSSSSVEMNSTSRGRHPQINTGRYALGEEEKASQRLLQWGNRVENSPKAGGRDFRRFSYQSLDELTAEKEDVRESDGDWEINLSGKRRNILKSGESTLSSERQGCNIA